MGATGRFKYGGKDVVLKGSELTEFKRFRAEYINSKLDNLVKSAAYTRANDKTKKKLIEKLYTKATNYAKIL